MRDELQSSKLMKRNKLWNSDEPPWAIETLTQFHLCGNTVFLLCGSTVLVKVVGTNDVNHRSIKKFEAVYGEIHTASSLY
jgi:hypothetical protein